MLRKPTALVTGAAGCLGLATVKNLLKNNFKVVMFDLPDSQGQKLGTSFGEQACFVPGDVQSEADVSNLMEKIRFDYKTLDVIVNCAGVTYSRMVYNDNRKSSAQMDSMIESLMTNVAGTFNVIRLGVAVMSENERGVDELRGVIINTSGWAAYDGQLGQSIQSASCGAIASMTLPLSRELGTLGIRVMAIAPGIIDGPLSEPMSTQLKNSLQCFVAAPKRFGRADEYAQLVQTIIENKFLNGEVIRLDGGLRLNLI